MSKEHSRRTRQMARWRPRVSIELENEMVVVSSVMPEESIGGTQS